MPQLPTQLQPALLAPGYGPTTLVNAATGTGTTGSYFFTIQPALNSQARILTLVASGAFSVCTITLKASISGTGGTFNAYSTADTSIDVHAAPIVQIKDLEPGLVYQISVATFTGTSITLTGELS
jgi:hypothetical protein